MIDFPPRPDLTNIILISGLIRATVVLPGGHWVLNLGRFSYNFENFGERKKKIMISGLFYGAESCKHVMIQGMLHESKTKRNAFPYLSKNASEAFNFNFTRLSKHFTHFKTILKFLTLPIFFPLLGLLCLVTPQVVFFLRITSVNVRPLTHFMKKYSSYISY